jgi:DNA damage-inducible protein 1
MSIDLKDNVLKCEGMSVPFLGEGDLPKHLMGMDDGGGSDAMDVEQAGASAGGASGSSAGAQPSGSQAGGDGDIPASAIEALTGMGFTREQALTALKR